MDNEALVVGENVVREKSFAFALRVVRLCQRLSGERREFVLSKQLLRSGTAIGALVREAEQAESRADFVHKMAVALKEASETQYWIELLHHSGYLDTPGFTSVYAELTELLKLLTAIIKTAKSRR
jgi:four helix bundle protein